MTHDDAWCAGVCATGLCDVADTTDGEEAATLAKKRRLQTQVVGGALGAVVLALVVVSVVIYKRQRKSSAELKGVMQTLEEFVTPAPDEWEIDPNNIEIKETLGSGR